MLPYFEWRGGFDRRTSVRAHLKSARQTEGRDLPVGGREVGARKGPETYKSTCK